MTDKVIKLKLIINIEIYGGTCEKELFGVKSGKTYFIQKEAHKYEKV